MWLLLQLEVPLDAVVHATKAAVRHGAGVVLNPAPAQPLPDELLREVSILVPNKREASLHGGIAVTDLASAGHAGRLLLDGGPQAQVITLGVRGALLVAGTQVVHVPAPRVEMVDTTAAGDAFVGGLATALVRGLALPDAVRFGVCTDSTFTTGHPLISTSFVV